MRKFSQFVLAGAVTILLTSAAAAQRPSFSCRGVHRCPEVTICATPELARLDSIMAGLYFSLQGLASRPEARALLANQQPGWLSETIAGATLPACSPSTVKGSAIFGLSSICLLSELSQNAAMRTIALGKLPTNKLPPNALFAAIRGVPALNEERRG